jgi:formate-dependent phosphoribosylglycinamide formyltransferase (GAR transformylase)
MRTVIYVTPFFTENALRFIETFANLPDARLGLICQESQERLAPGLREKIAAHWRCDNTLDSRQLAFAAGALRQALGQINSLVGATEQLQVPLAEARAELGVPGMSVGVAQNFRDKARMKQIFRENGVPCARYRRVLSDEDAWKFAAETGFPLVLKPLAGAGSHATYRVNNAEELKNALQKVAPGPHNEAIIEEFIVGDEHSLETISIGGRAVWHSLTRYYPTPLEVMQNAWIQWRVVLPREIDDAKYDDIREAGSRALEVLGMDSGISHLEWFRRRDGSVAVSEVAARPPGAQIMTLISRAHDCDFNEKWARLRVWGTFEPPERRFSSGAAYLRGQGKGRVKAIHGLDQAHKEIGSLVTDVKLPQTGQMPSTSYEGDGYIIVRHPETAVVEQALERIVSLVRLELG